MIGRTIGKYRIVAQIGRGGMGTVYKAIDETLDREVAIKVLNPELADTDIMKRFRAEATTLAKLNHPEIATIYELFRSETDLLMVMEFVKGETLDKISDRLGPMPAERAAYLIDKVLSALEHAHRAGVVHRDMKPANVMVTEIGSVKIMDFGIARVRGAEHMTVDGYMMGTPAYMPPEQVLGQEVDGRADLYAVGVVFYRLLTGALPFKADTAIGMVQKQISETPIPLNSLREDLPDWCETILERALSKAPGDRYQTAEEFREALSKASGVLTVEHSKAFASVDLRPEIEIETPAHPIKLDRLPTPAPRPSTPPGPRGRGASTTPHSSVPKTVPNAPPLEGATIILRKQHFAVAGSLLAVLALSMAVLAFVALWRSNPLPAVATTENLPATPPVTAPPLSTAPASSPAAAPVEPAAPPPPVAAAPAARKATPDKSAKPTPAAVPRGDTTRAAADNSAENTTDSKPSSPEAPARAFVPLAFESRALIDESELEAMVHLSDGRITVSATDDPDNAVHSMPYDRIESISYSRGRDPMWKSPSGPAPVARLGAGALGGIFRGTRYWLTLKTKEQGDPFIVLRFGNDVLLKRAMHALQERTGHLPELVVPRKDAK
jgi:serine/threonine-protein kinase